MTSHTFRRWTVGLWLPLALAAVVIALLRCAAVMDNGPANNTTTCEDISIYNISAVAAGERAYVDCFAYPYRTSLFNWLFYRTYGAAAQLADPTPDQLPNVLRLVTFAFVLLGLTASVWVLLPDAEGHGAPGGILVGSLAVLTWFGPVIAWWPWTVRPDLPAIVLELLAFGLVLRSDAAWRAFAAGVLFFFAWSFKQNEVAILAGTALGLLLQRGWRPALLLLTAFIVPTVLILLQADDAYWINVARGPALASWSVGAIWHKLAGWLFQGGLYLFAPAVLLAYVLAPAERRATLQQPAVRFAAVVFAVTLTLNLLGSGRQWSARNYFYESWVIGMTFTGLVTLQTVRTFTEFPSPRGRNAFVAMTVVLLLSGAGQTIAVFVPLDKPYARTGESLPSSVRLPRPSFPPALRSAVQASPRPVLCDDPLLLMAALGKDAGGSPVIEYTIYLDAVRAGLIQDEDIAQRIRNRYFAAIWLEPTGSIWEPIAHEAGYAPGDLIGSMRCWTRP